ncbi:uncharacterized protein [Palaemon carinicauda]|uniref:uncharacterized protein n=1 Tax=Palaemon carinicauda TaxID=392227 RepID=UPI0035B6883B
MNEEAFSVELSICEQYVDKVTEMLAILEDKPNVVSDNSSRSLLKNPVIPLPTFNSSPDENINRFFQEFESVSEQQQFSNRDKFLLLKQQVHGRAEYLINSLELSSQSYEDAKNLLSCAFASTDLQKYNTVRMFSELKLKSSDDPFSYIGRVRSLIENVKLLKMNGDDFAQYFVWEGLNETFKQHLISITNNVRPSLEDIQEHFFEASDRYLPDSKAHSKTIVKEKCEKVSSTNLAISVDKRNIQRGCLLCCNSDYPLHKVSECEVYRTPEKKLERIVELGRCLKCCGQGHLANNCFFRFHKRCFKCNEWHFSYLCTKEPKVKKVSRVESKTGAKSKVDKAGTVQIKNGSALIAGSVTSCMGDMALPTFTCKSKTETFRALLDSGCQGNFITSELATGLDCEVICDGISVEVNGFNASRKYKTKLVAVDLDIGDKNYKIQAICVPNIGIDILVPNLSKLAQAFKKKGYVIADNQLLNSDRISNVKFVLGTSSAHCLLTTAKLFGDINPLVYLDSPVGILFMGEASKAFKVVDEIPTLKNEVQFRLASFLCVQPRECVLDEWQDNVNDKDSNFIIKVNKQSNKVLNAIADRALDEKVKEVLNYENISYEEDSELNNELVKNTLSNIRINDEGRLTMPLMWNQRTSHLLGQNINISKGILASNFKKLKRNPEHLSMVDDVIQEQIEMGIIERISNVEKFLEKHPEASFLAHMPIFRPDKETTKCRVVFMSNLGESVDGRPLTVTHNQAMHPGPNLNQKLSTAFMNLRFGSKLLCYDIKKAFNQVALTEEDQIVDDCDPNLTDVKRLLYQLLYMDNGAYTCSSGEKLNEVYKVLPSIFEKYKFPLQQFVTNDPSLQEVIDREGSGQTPHEVSTILQIVLLVRFPGRSCPVLTIVVVQIMSSLNKQRFRKRY